MVYIGTYRSRDVYWLEYSQSLAQFPSKDWIWLAIVNNEPNYKFFENLVRNSISKNLLEFKAHGTYGEFLHDSYDGVISIMEIMEGHEEVDVVTTWHNKETLQDTFWQCFFVTCLPETADINSIKICCTDLDGINRSEELRKYIKDFKSGWLPNI